MTNRLPESVLNQFATFGDLLKFLRRRAGLTQRELSISVGYSHAQISRLELNQRLPDMATVAARFIPALELDDEPKAASRLLELATATLRSEAPVPGQAPFKGLQFFDEDDAEMFFGREQLTHRLLERLRESLFASPQLRFLAVVGASGSGKSSIVRAGLIPALRHGSSFADWQVCSLKPSAHPLEALALSLTENDVSVAATASLMDDFGGHNLALSLVVKRLISKRRAGVSPSQGKLPQRLLLVVDQFEELFSLCQDEAERCAFINNLITAASHPDGETFVLLALRADFYSRCAPYASLRDALAARQEYIGPMNTSELRRAIEEPARRAGWELEPGLVEILLNDIGAGDNHTSTEIGYATSSSDQTVGDVRTAGEPGALPLLSHALLETWRRRHGRRLTISGYLSSGGVRGAIAETADSVFQDELDAEQQQVARRIFLRLTQPGDNEATGDSRRRANLQELTLRPEDAPIVGQVLTKLADARLIITDRDTAEIAHEALIREWPALRGWLEEDRESLRLHRHLTLAAGSWEHRKRDPGELYRSTRLAQALDWAETYRDELSSLERAFLDASLALAGQEEAEREALRTRELETARALAETQQRAAIQLRRRAIYLSGALVLALIMAGIAIFQGQRAQQSALTALHEQRIAFGRELAAAALSNLAIDPERSGLLAMQAILTTRLVDGTVLPEAEEALHHALVNSMVRMTLTGHNTRVYTVAYSPDGKKLASIGSDGTTILWDAVTGKQALRLPGSTSQSDFFSIKRLAFRSDGKQLVTAQGDQIDIWDTSSGQLIRKITGNPGEITAVAFSPDGGRIASGDIESSVRIWDSATGQMLYELAGHTDAIEDLAFSPDGKWLATASDDQTLKIWDASTGELLRDLVDFSTLVDSVDFSPDGSRLAATSGSLRIWDATHIDGQVVLTIPGNLVAAVFSPDGNHLATGSGSQAILWDAHTGQQLRTLAGHSQWVVDEAFSPDGKQLATASFDGTVRVWSLMPGQEALTISGQGPHVVYSPDGSRLATDGIDGSAAAWDAGAGEQMQAFSGHTNSVMGVAFTPDGSKLATASLDTTARIWDINTGQQLLTLTGHDIGIRDIAVSPDGRVIASAGFDETARLWDAATGRQLFSLTAHDGLVLGVAFSPDGILLATSSSDNTAKIWDVQTGQLLRTLRGHTSPIPDVAFSPDGTKLATGSGDITAKIWDVATGAALLTLQGHSSGISSVAFSPDGKLLATGSGDNTAKVWDLTTGKELHTLPGSQGGVTGVAFSPQDGGAHLAVASSDGIVRVFLLHIDDLLRLAGSRFTRSLTQEECRKFLHTEACPTSQDYAQ